MKERPILFSAPMIKAIRAGTKTQTRRVVNNAGLYAVEAEFHGQETAARELLALATRCSQGQPGDFLWVREAWRAASDFDLMPPRDIAEGAHVWYEADDKLSAIRGLSRMGKLRPSMFMPRWASRITLQITEVRVERLNSISQGDALAEGITTVRTPAWDSEHFPDWRRDFDAACVNRTKPPVGPSPRDSYQALWDQINGRGAWAVNPWVFVIGFEVVKP